eukprot:scaffold26115_cov132-Cylindrotheca_fusiformis.AAC.1
MVQKGARFLRHDEEMGIWVLVDRELAVKKVSHALRCKKHLSRSSKFLQGQEANRSKEVHKAERLQSQVSSIPPRAAPFKTEPQLVQSWTAIPPSSPARNTAFRLTVQDERKALPFPFSGSNYMTFQYRNHGTLIALEDLRRRDLERRHQLVTMLEIERHQHQAQSHAASALCNASLWNNFY